MGLLNLNDTTKTKLAILALLCYEAFVKNSVVGSFACKSWHIISVCFLTLYKHISQNVRFLH